MKATGGAAAYSLQRPRHRARSRRSTGRRRRSTRCSTGSPRTRSPTSSPTAVRSRRCRRGASLGGGPMNDQQISERHRLHRIDPGPDGGLHRRASSSATPATCPRATRRGTPRRPTRPTRSSGPPRRPSPPGTYKTLGEALFNLDLNSGAYSCARCHTTGWSYGNPQQSGGGAMGPNLTNGSTVRQFPNDGRPGRLRRDRLGERQALRPAGPGLGPHARRSARCSPQSRSRPSSTTSGVSDAASTSVLAVRLEPRDPGHPRSCVVGIVVLCGSVYLLLGTNLGARLGFLVAMAGLFGWLTLLGSVVVGVRQHLHHARPAGPPAGRGMPRRSWSATSRSRRVSEVAASDPTTLGVRQPAARQPRASARRPRRPTRSWSPRPASSPPPATTRWSPCTTRTAARWPEDRALRLLRLVPPAPLRHRARCSPSSRRRPSRAGPRRRRSPTPSQPPVYVVMERDLGTQRVPPATVAIGSGIIFAITLSAAAPPREAGQPARQRAESGTSVEPVSSGR